MTEIPKCAAMKTDQNGAPEASPRLRRKSERDLDLLEGAVAKCLGDNLAPRDPRQIAREVLAAGRLAQVEHEFRRGLRTDEFRAQDQEDQRRMVRGSDRYWRVRRKDGTAKAGQAVLDLWDKPLTYRDRQIKTQALPKLRRAAVVTHALLAALSDGLGRRLRFSRSRTGGPDVVALVTTWNILFNGQAVLFRDRIVLHGDPDESLPVQRPGSARWFENAIREQRKQKLPPTAKIRRQKAEEE